MRRVMFMPNKNVTQVIRETIIDCMKKDKNIILFGEGIDDDAAMFKTTSGTLNLFGKNRVFEMPLSENCIVGAAIGAAIEGDKVIVNFQRVEFSLLAIEQIFNNAAKLNYLTSGRHKSPIVIRLVIGKGWGQGPVHSQSLENIFTAIPGLKVMMPVFPNETKDLLYEAINDLNPVIFIENRWCHFLYGKVKDGYNKKNKHIAILNRGSDLTILSSGYFSAELINMVKFFKKHNINIDLLHLRILSFGDKPELLKSVKKTKKIIVIDSGYKNFSASSEILSDLIEKYNDFIIKPKRIGIPFQQMPSSRGYIKNIYPQKEYVFEEIIKMLEIKKKELTQIKKDFYKIFKTSLNIDQPDKNFQGPF